jgi:hypothetical protein
MTQSISHQTSLFRSKSKRPSPYSFTSRMRSAVTQRYENYSLSWSFKHWSYASHKSSPDRSTTMPVMLCAKAQIRSMHTRKGQLFVLEYRWMETIYSRKVGILRSVEVVILTHMTDWFDSRSETHQLRSMSTNPGRDTIDWRTAHWVQA